MAVEEILFEISEGLRVPVLVLTIAALAFVVAELGALLTELVRRRRRSMRALEIGVEAARSAITAGDPASARAALAGISWSGSMRGTLTAIVDLLGRRDSEGPIAKQLADFDYACIRKLERTRLLVRFGPALGLMGTLIPLSPALAGLAGGDVVTLTENLRVAFSVTVAGLLVGAVAFAISLVRDRLYGQDFSDAEFVASKLVNGTTPTMLLPSAQPHPVTPATAAAQVEP